MDGGGQGQVKGQTVQPRNFRVVPLDPVSAARVRLPLTQAGHKAFTPGDDRSLLAYIDKHGNQKSSWDSLTKLFDGERSEASLRSRWSRLAKGLVKGQTVQPGNVVPLDPVSAALQRQVQFNSILDRF